MTTADYLASPSGAVISGCQKYRYVLWRRWDWELGFERAKPMVFIGLNPSTADASENDPTITRCIGFARRLGCGGLVMLNLFAFRSTDPAMLPSDYAAATGQFNDAYIKLWMPLGAITVAAWGAIAPKGSPRMSAVSALACDAVGGLWCFGTTQNGAPRHPLYLKSETPIKVWCGSPKEIAL